MTDHDDTSPGPARPQPAAPGPYGLEPAGQASADPTRTGSALVAGQIWAMLRRLGVDHGRMLVSGKDPAALAGAPHPSAVDTGEFVAAIPPAGWPHNGLRLHRRTPGPPEVYDVIVHNAPQVDLRARHPQNTATLVDLQGRMVLKAMRHTSPGGFTVAIVSHQVLDIPDAKHRHQMLDLSDLVGAARLPAGLLHAPPQPGPASATGHAVDLLVLRRRPDGDRVRSMPFVFLSPAKVDGTPTVVNEYYDEMPEHVLGTPHLARTDRGPVLTLAHEHDVGGPDLGRALHDVLSGIARRGTTQGLTAAFPRTPPDQPPTPGPTVPRRSTRPAPSTASLSPPTRPADRPGDTPPAGPGL